MLNSQDFLKQINVQLRELGGYGPQLKIPFIFKFFLKPSLRDSSDKIGSRSQ